MSFWVYLFFYDLYFIRRSKYLFLLVKIIFLPVWVYYRFLSRNKHIVLFIRTDIFGMQLFEFQQLNQIAIKSDLKMMHIVNVLGLATKRFNIRKNIVIGIINNGSKMQSRRILE